MTTNIQELIPERYAKVCDTSKLCSCSMLFPSMLRHRAAACWAAANTTAAMVPAAACNLTVIPQSADLSKPWVHIYLIA